MDHRFDWIQEQRDHRRAERVLLTLALIAAVLATVQARAQQVDPAQQDPVTHEAPPTPEDSTTIATADTPATGIDRFTEESRLMYTTYFYTAGEAIVHGYEADTHVLIMSMDGGRVVWEGTVGPGEMANVPTGAGVFAYVSDKKAAILVGTPSSCAVVGYWPRDANGSFRSDRFYTMLPSYTHHPDDRVIIWAWEDTDFKVVDVTADRELHSGSLQAGQYYELGVQQLSSMHSHLLYVEGTSSALSVQIYYDQGFSVPGRDGRTSSTLFYTYVGNVTEGANDLNIISYHDTAQVKVEDIHSEEVLWQGPIEPGQIQTLTLSQRFVRVSSDIEVSVSVAPYRHYVGPYAEHHFNLGAEGTGIENLFLVTTPEEIWLFSYFDDTTIQVTDTTTGNEIWTGQMNAGNAQGIFPGQGYYRITSTRGISVLGGSQACGGEFSPASSMFAMDEAVLRAVVDVRHTRQAQAAAEGRTLSEEELNRELSGEELDRVVRQVRASSGFTAAPAADVRSRLESLQMQ
ncbi:MAG: hypothetical protein JW797_19855 [Bradymonadales bacterium]|nr:hypothetical protein [Bradymonadales bacterium]